MQKLTFIEAEVLEIANYAKFFENFYRRKISKAAFPRDLTLKPPPDQIILFKNYRIGPSDPIVLTKIAFVISKFIPN